MTAYQYTLSDIRALKEFLKLYPSWWYRIGVCDVSRDFTCAPQKHSPEIKNIKHPGDCWDAGFSCDSRTTLAAGIHDVMRQIKAEQELLNKDAFAEAYKSGNLKMRNDLTGEMQTVWPDLEYVIVSVGKTGKKDPYITFWRPDNKGYAWPLAWAGSYSHEQVIADPDYYDNGTDTIAVLRSSLGDFAIPKPISGMIDGDVGSVIQNNKDNWRRLYEARIKR